MTWPLWLGLLLAVAVAGVSVSALTIDMAGTFNMSATAEHWKPFTSRQRVVTRRPGSLWDARVTMLPGLAVRVVDSYIAGSGLLQAAILGLAPSRR